MPGAGNHSKSKRDRSLQVTGREALTLLSALELSPFDDEVLTQKLLNLVYSNKPSHETARRLRRTHDFTHHRR
jgi:hypothetical protein